MDNLPVALSSFVGREQELKAVAKVVAGSRLVTLTGVAGVGKTRLAVEVARTQREHHDDGVWLVQLAPLADPGLVPAAVAATLGVAEQPGRSLPETLATHLRPRSLLLVLDNCEHVIDAAATFADTLLASCPSLSILATSREPLGIAGEAVWPVPPLEVPPEAGEFLPEALVVCDAARLFVDRATASDPGFLLTPAVAPIVDDICRRLDGIPLAIELAAARVGVLTPAEIAARLDDRFRLLATGSRTAAPRHRSLQAALDWSHELLTEPEQVLLRRLSVFAGGCTLEAAEAVCAGDGVERWQVFDLLAGLVAKSLTVADTSGPQARYRLLETVRHLAAEKLAAAAEKDAVSERHAAYYTQFAERAEPNLTGSDQVAWLKRLDADHANFRAALAWSLERSSEWGPRLAAALPMYWMVRRHLREGRAWLEQALAAADGPPYVRARALLGKARLVGWAGEFADAIDLAKESLAVAREAAEHRIAAHALYVMGACGTFQNLANAREALEESVSLARRTRDDWCLAGALGQLGWVRAFEDAYADAHKLFDECLEIARRGQDKQGLCTGLIGCGHVRLQQGDLADAEALLQEGLAIARELDDPFWAGLAMIYLGELARAKGEYDLMRSLAEEALSLTTSSRASFVIAGALGFLAQIEQAEGNPEAARDLFARALPIAKTAGDKRSAGRLLLGLGEASQSMGDLQAATENLEEAVAYARESSSKRLASRALYRLGGVALARGDREHAEASFRDSLRLAADADHVRGVASCLEALASLALQQERHEHAARLLGAAEGLRRAHDSPRSASQEAACMLAADVLEKHLGPEVLAAERERGAALSLGEAVTFASKGRGPRQRPATGWESLTPTERDVARLTAAGLTNPEIGERLFVSPRTVQTHLAHIFAKLEIHSRREIAGRIPDDR